MVAIYLHGISILVFEMGQMIGILMNSVEMAKGLDSSMRKFLMIFNFVSFGSVRLVLFRSEALAAVELIVVLSRVLVLVLTKI